MTVVPDNPGDDGIGETANQWATPTIDDQGGVDVAYALEDCNTGIDRGLRFKRSTTGGDTWPANPVKINKPGQFKDNPDEGDHLAPKNARIPISPSLVYNDVTQTLGYVYQNNINRSVSKADVTFQRSTDYGATWSDIKYVAVTGSGAPAPNDQFFPWIDFDGSGHFHVVFFDNRNDPNNLLIETFIGESTNNGATWTNTRISDVAWNPNLAFFSSGAFIGDYNGLAVAGNDVAYPVWTDGRLSPGPPLGQTDPFTDPYTP
ncbi:MAG: glycoside hydrolase [Actinobacteria bacterium]|nr:glycoside hydrolase [Actinomycetota bacterium]